MRKQSRDLGRVRLGWRIRRRLMDYAIPMPQFQCLTKLDRGLYALHPPIKDDHLSPGDVFVARLTTVVTEDREAVYIILDPDTPTTPGRPREIDYDRGGAAPSGRLVVYHAPNISVWLA